MEVAKTLGQVQRPSSYSANNYNYLPNPIIDGPERVNAYLKNGERIKGGSIEIPVQ